MKLDIIDLKILKALQENSKITNIELSKVIGLSAAPTLGRVQKLEKSGVSTFPIASGVIGVRI